MPKTLHQGILCCLELLAVLQTLHQGILQIAPQVRGAG